MDERHGITGRYGHMGMGRRAGEMGRTPGQSVAALDRRCGAAKHKRGPRLARSATGAAPGHVAEEGVCKRWTLLILVPAHTDINEAPCRHSV